MDIQANSPWGIPSKEPQCTVTAGPCWRDKDKFLNKLRAGVTVLGETYTHVHLVRAFLSCQEHSFLSALVLKNLWQIPALPQK